MTRPRIQSTLAALPCTCFGSSRLSWVWMERVSRVNSWRLEPSSSRSWDVCGAPGTCWVPAVGRVARKTKVLWLRSRRPNCNHKATIMKPLTLQREQRLLFEKRHHQQPQCNREEIGSSCASLAMTRGESDFKSFQTVARKHTPSEMHELPNCKSINKWIFL